MRSHLALEAVLNGALMSAARGPNELDRLPFLAKVDVAIALGKVDADLRPAYVIANQLRNKYAHRLDAELAAEEGESFLASFNPSTWDGALVRASRAAWSAPPRDQVAFGFATLFIHSATQAGMLREVLGPMLEEVRRAEGT